MERGNHRYVVHKEVEGVGDGRWWWKIIIYIKTFSFFYVVTNLKSFIKRLSRPPCEGTPFACAKRPKWAWLFCAAQNWSPVGHYITTTRKSWNITSQAISAKLYDVRKLLLWIFQPRRIVLNAADATKSGW